MKNANIKGFGGFTLIELLVVVLIIGILSSVALPQYQKAVEKSRSAEAISMWKTVAVAERLYRMNNGTYTRSVDGLDIEVPNLGGNRGYGYNEWRGKNFMFNVEGGTSTRERIKGKAYPHRGSSNSLYAINMNLDIEGKLTIWCTSTYHANYSMNGVEWDPSVEASALCKGISGKSNGLILETNL